MEVGIFIPCFIDQIFPETGMNMATVLKHYRTKPLYNPAQTCCGQVAFNNGYHDECKHVAEKFIMDFVDYKYVVGPSASCIGMVKNYFPSMFDNSAFGLSKAMVNLSNFDTIIETARQGKPDNVDLSISDISRADIGNLPGHLTASNFGKMNDQASRSDITLGILTMVFQVVGMLAIFAARAENYRDIVLTGKLVHVFKAEKTFSELSSLYAVNFHVPVHAEYCTAIGAAIS